jgi:hypothetical protein
MVQMALLVVVEALGHRQLQEVVALAVHPQLQEVGVHLEVMAHPELQVLVVRLV